MLLMYAIAAGLIAGRMLGGRVRNLEHVHLVWWHLAVAGLLVQLVLFVRPVAEQVGNLGPLVYVASTMAVLVALLRNLRLPGLGIIGIGAVLNLLVIVLNGGYMPSSPEAWLELTGSAALPVSHYTNVALIGPDTLVPFLGDVLVFPRALPMATAFSAGDALIALGAIVFLVSAMRRQPLRGPAPSRALAQPASH